MKYTHSVRLQTIEVQNTIFFPGTSPFSGKLCRFRTIQFSNILFFTLKILLLLISFQKLSLQSSFFCIRISTITSQKIYFISKAGIRNPLSLLAHERSRFATCQWELLTPTDISIPPLSALRTWSGGMLILRSIFIPTRIYENTYPLCKTDRSLLPPLIIKRWLQSS